MSTLIEYSDCKVENPKTIARSSVTFNKLDLHKQNGFMLNLFLCA